MVEIEKINSELRRIYEGLTKLIVHVVNEKTMPLPFKISYARARNIKGAFGTWYEIYCDKLLEIAKKWVTLDRRGDPKMEYKMPINSKSADICFVFALDKKQEEKTPEDLKGEETRESNFLKERKETLDDIKTKVEVYQFDKSWFEGLCIDSTIIERIFPLIKEENK